MTRSSLINTLFVCCSLFSLQCGITQPVRTLEEGKTEIISSFGGPIIPLDGLAIPTPYLNAGVLYGQKANLTLYGNAHVTAFLFKDVGLDGGVATTVVKEKQWRPEITLNGRLYFFWDFIRSNNARIFPMATLIGSYQTGERSLFYFGVDNLYQISTQDIFISPLVGYEFPLSETMLSQVELKWLAANKNTRHGVFEGVTSISGNGGVGIFIGVQYSLE